MQRATLASGIELDYVDEGPRDAPALIFLHGFPESHRTWRHQIAHLSSRFRCIAPDQRGYRGSSKPQDVEAYVAPKLAQDVFELADALGVGTFTVIGHDWGGAVAWLVAMLGQGTRVERLVIANSPHPAIFQRLLFLDPQQRAASQYMRDFRDPAHDALVRDHGLIGMLAHAVKWEVPAALEDDVRHAQFADWEDRDAAFAMLNWYRASQIVVPDLDAPYEIPADFKPPTIPKLTLPTLVIWAVDDLALPIVNVEQMDAWIDDLTLVRVPDCGHFVTWEAPAAVNAAMDAFLG